MAKIRSIMCFCSLLLLFGVDNVLAQGECVDIAVPVTVTNVTNIAWAFPEFQDGYQATAFINALTTRDGNPADLVKGPVNVTGSYTISVQYCTPVRKTSRSSTVQILTHGLGFDKSYWNFTLVPGNYSYIAQALAAGYSTLSYDRLGTGLSTKADPYTEIQAPLELTILIELTAMLRSGKIAGCDIPLKVVHVGHSYGSILTNGLTAAEPALTDGIVLTGYSNNLTFQGLFLATGGHLASENQPARFSGYSSGYLTWADKYYNQYDFLYYPYFDSNVLNAAEATKWPFTVGQLLTGGSLPFTSPNYKGPVLYLAAQRDLIFCGSDCEGVVDGPYSTSPSLFPSASTVEFYIQPNVGHGISLHYNASGGYEVALNFLSRTIG